MKKLIVIFLSVTLSIGLVLWGSYSWYFAEENLPNEFSIAHFSVILNEVFTGWEQKEVSAVNTGELPALVRLAAIPILTYTDEDGVRHRLNIEGRVNLTRPDHFDDYWYNAGDGWYYYKQALLPAQETTLFLTKAEFVGDAEFFAQHPEYIGAELQVDVIMESAPVTATYEHAKMWDLKNDQVLILLLEGICDLYFG